MFPGLCTGGSSYLPPSDSGELIFPMQSFFSKKLSPYCNRERRLVLMLQQHAAHASDKNRFRPTVYAGLFPLTQGPSTSACSPPETTVPRRK